MSTKKDGGIEHLAADHANQAGGTEREVVTDLPHKGPLCSPLAINVEYDSNVDHAEDILDRLAVLDTAVRAAHAHIRCRTVHGATLRRVHDAALRVIGAARSPRHAEGADPDIDYVDTVGKHVYEAMDRLAEKLTMPSGGINDASPTWAAEGGDAPYRAPVWAPCAPDREYSPNVDDPDDILDLLAVLDGAVRDAHAQIRGGTVSGATLSRVHDAALRVIGAARDPRDTAEGADRGRKYLETMCMHACEGMDRLAEELTMPDGD